MGECEVNDVEVDGGGVGRGHGVLVKRRVPEGGARTAGPQRKLQARGRARHDAVFWETPLSAMQHACLAGADTSRSRAAPQSA